MIYLASRQRRQIYNQVKGKPMCLVHLRIASGRKIPATSLGSEGKDRLESYMPPLYSAYASAATVRCHGFP
jgi:hypothetical protein